MKRLMMVTALMLAAGGVVRAEDAKKTEEKPPTPAATSQPAVRVDVTKADEIKGAIGKDAVVVGTVETGRWTTSGKTLILTFKDAPEDFRLRGYGENRADLDKAFGGDVATYLVGKKVEVTGPITKYNGSVENWKKFTDVTVKKVEQIKVVEEKK